MSLERVSQGGTDAVRLTAGSIQATVATGFGPRVIGFGAANGPNLFAELSNAGIDLPDGRRFVFHGGHRLWVAPEEPARTYEPDADPVEIAETTAGLVVAQSTTTADGLVKSLELSAVGEATLEVRNVITNRSTDDVAVVPWAITQLAPGGIGILPHGIPGADGPQASTMLVGWPYTDLADPGLHIETDLVLVATDRSTPTKIGTDLQRGWLAYVMGERVFVKRANHVEGAYFVDRGAAAQIYCDGSFIELETLGPLQTLAPGDAATLVETWTLASVPAGTVAARVPATLGLDG